MGDKLQDLLGGLVDKAAAHTVIVNRGWPAWVYTDGKGNQLTDGPLLWDSATCVNHARPTSQQIAEALRTIQRQGTTSDSSTSYVFEGINPIADMCARAPRAR